MLITDAYFKNEPLYIPSAGTTAVGISKHLDNIKDKNISNYINKYEPKYLKLLLGEDLYNLFYLGMSEIVIEDKWLALKNKLVDEVLYESPIANYIYVQYLRRRPITDIGLVKPIAENATVISTIPLQTDIWNDMVESNIKICDWLIDNQSIYDPNNDIYPLWVADEGLLKYSNSFGI